MLTDARQGRFDTIICWKSDRLSRGMYPAAALMEVIEAHRINLEAVMDAIDMKTFGLMAAVGKIELDNFRSSMGKRGSAKQGTRAHQQRPLQLPDWRGRQGGGGGSRGRCRAPRLQNVRPQWQGSPRHPIPSLTRQYQRPGKRSGEGLPNRLDPHSGRQPEAGIRQFEEPPVHSEATQWGGRRHSKPPKG